MKRREQWRPVLEAEVKRWSGMTFEELISAVADGQTYEIEFESKKYQIEVELLDRTESYVNVNVAVDDGTLPASIVPLCSNFISKRGG